MRTTTGTAVSAVAPNSKTAVIHGRRPEPLVGDSPRRIVSAALKVLAAFVVACTFAPAASAVGGNYVIQGGTSYERLQVHEALDASSFNWSLVPETITIVIDPAITRDQSITGEILLDPALLDSGEFGWGAVQNEYAQQVDLLLLTDAQRAIFNSALGGTAWCYGDEPGLQLAQYGCERFASTLAWAYWSSPLNCIQPADAGVVSASMPPAAFRALLTSELGVPTVSQVLTVRQTQSVTQTRSVTKLSPRPVVRGLE